MTPATRVEPNPDGMFFLGMDLQRPGLVDRLISSRDGVFPKLMRSSARRGLLATVKLQTAGQGRQIKIMASEPSNRKSFIRSERSYSESETIERAVGFRLGDLVLVVSLLVVAAFGIDFATTLLLHAL